MKYLQFCTLFVFSTQIIARNLAKYVRETRRDEVWNWGYVDVTESNANVFQTERSTELAPHAKPRNRTNPDIRDKKSQTNPTDITSSRDQSSPKDEANPCDSLKYPKPDFNTPGRRISDSKCYEYIWEIKHRADEKKCLEYEQEYQKFNQGGFAVGGRNTWPGEFPHMYNINSGLQDVDILRFIMHPHYASPKKYYDIALIELRNEVIFNGFVQPACLWNKFDTSSLRKEATVTGWGVVDLVTRAIALELQAAMVSVIASSRCDELLRSRCSRLWCGIQEHQICAGNLTGGVDACQGDSGGPLQVKINLPSTAKGNIYYVIGVTSFGIKCGLANTPGVYSRVSSFIDWIEDIVWR